MTRGSNDTVQVRAQRRKDGRWSVRVDLVGWDRDDLDILMKSHVGLLSVAFEIEQALRDADELA